MDTVKDNYKNGLVWFMLLAFLIASLFHLPDGEIVMYKLLGLFNISYAIHTGNGGRLYIFSLIAVVLIVVSGKRVMKHWQGFGFKFKSFNKSLRYLPLIIIIALFVFNANINNIYYGLKSFERGVKSVAYYQISENKSELFNYDVDSGLITYHYDFTFENYGNDVAAFQIKVINEYYDVKRLGQIVPPELFIKNSDGTIKTVTLNPNERARIKGEFTELDNTECTGGGALIPTVVLISEKEQYSPKPIAKLPNL